jgi:uncharacterized coiled-coil protein SlyX
MSAQKSVEDRLAFLEERMQILGVQVAKQTGRVNRFLKSNSRRFAKRDRHVDTVQNKFRRLQDQAAHCSKSVALWIERVEKIEEFIRKGVDNPDVGDRLFGLRSLLDDIIHDMVRSYVEGIAINMGDVHQTLAPIKERLKKLETSLDEHAECLDEHDERLDEQETRTKKLEDEL